MNNKTFNESSDALTKKKEEDDIMNELSILLENAFISVKDDPAVLERLSVFVQQLIKSNSDNYEVDRALTLAAEKRIVQANEINRTSIMDLVESLEEV